MPSPHKRIGLVVDDPVRQALDTVRRGAGSNLPDARVARQAVLEGALLEALRSATGGRTAEREKAAAIIEELRELTPKLDLPKELRDLVGARMEAATEAMEGDRLREKQLALIGGPDVHGERALELAEEFDELER